MSRYEMALKTGGVEKDVRKYPKGREGVVRRGWLGGGGLERVVRRD